MTEIPLIKDSRLDTLQERHPSNLRRRFENSYEILGAAGVRLMLLPFGGAATLLAARFTTHERGIAFYGMLTLIVQLPAVVAVADLGLGAAATNAAAEDRPPYTILDAVWSNVSRRLALIALFAIGLLIAGAVTNVWAQLLGITDASANLAVTASFSLFFLSIPFGISSRVLIGLGHAKVSVFLQGLSPLMTSAFIIFGLTLGGNLATTCLTAGLGGLASSVICHFAALRASGLKRVFRRRRIADSTRLRRIAGPAFIIAATLPLTFQTDRALINHSLGPVVAGQYAVVAILYAPANSVLAAVHATLWGRFARRRARLQVTPADIVRCGIFASACGGLIAIGLLLLGGRVSSWISPDIGSSRDLIIAFATLLLLSSTAIAPGAAMTDARGLRIQASECVVMAMLTLPLSWLSLSKVGPAGPVWCSALGVLVFQIMPNWVLALKLDSAVEATR